MALGAMSPPARAPLQRLVRQRVLENAAAPHCRACKLSSKSDAMLWRAATDCNERTVQQRGGVHKFGGTRTRCLTPSISGAANGIQGMMRNSLRGLRCMLKLDVRLSSNDPQREYYFDLDGCNRLLAHLSEFLVQAGLIQHPQLVAECYRIAR
jgi:hypothetical protein